ncbi:MAG: response regulator [Bryobacteraceae bacterium]
MRPRTVLIVSPDRRVRSALKSLGRPDLRILEAASGLAALVICASVPADLVAIDRSVPDMDTLRLIEKLSGAFPDMPVMTFPAGDTTATVRENLTALLESAVCRKQPALAYAAPSAVRRQRRA